MSFMILLACSISASPASCQRSSAAPQRSQLGAPGRSSFPAYRGAPARAVRLSACSSLPPDLPRSLRRPAVGTLQRPRRFIFSPIRNVMLDWPSPLQFWPPSFGAGFGSVGLEEGRIKRPREREGIDVAEAPEPFLADLVKGTGAVEVAACAKRHRPAIIGLLARARLPFLMRARSHADVRGLDPRRGAANAASVTADEGEERGVLDARLALAEVHDNARTASSLASFSSAISSSDPPSTSE